MVRFFVSVKAAGEDRPIAVMSVVVLQSAKPIKKPKKFGKNIRRIKSEGKKAHREAENRRRIGLSKKNKEILDDRGSTLQCSYSKIATSTNFGDKEQIGSAGSSSIRFGWCHFCGSFGVIVDRFPRRGYGKQNYSIKMAFVTPEKG